MPRLSALLFLALAPWLAQAEETLRVYNWNDYIDPQVLESFQKDTGIRVEYHTFATAEELDKALRSGEAIDVAVPSHDTLPALLKDNLLRPLDFTQLPNRSHLDRQLLSKLARSILTIATPSPIYMGCRRPDHQYPAGRSRLWRGRCPTAGACCSTPARASA